jgi:hypothetical protein
MFLNIADLYFLLNCHLPLTQVSGNLIKIISMASTSQEQKAVPVNVDVRNSENVDFLINNCRYCKPSLDDYW